MADARAQRGAEEAMEDIRGDVKQLAGVETLLMRSQRRGAAITHEICKDADPTKLDRPPHLPNQLPNQKRRQLDEVSGHHMRK
eukprot:2147062-Pyramimonas_sp.AAC.1